MLCTAQRRMLAMFLCKYQAMLLVLVLMITASADAGLLGKVRTSNASMIIDGLTFELNKVNEVDNNNTEVSAT